jgi:Outer membrane protein beta-barrel domain
MNTALIHFRLLSAWSKLALIFLCGALGLNAQSVGTTTYSYKDSEPPRESIIPQNSFRSERMELSFFLRNFTAPELTVADIRIPLLGTHDAVMSIEDSLVYGVSFGFNYNERVNLNIDLGYGQPDFEAVWGTDIIYGQGSMWLGDLNLEYNILKRRFSPFVGAGVGFFTFDSGVPSGGGFYTWWDPFWGYVSGIAYTTHSSTTFTWNASAGARWDISDNFYLKGAYQMIWGKVGISGTEAFPQYTLNIGWRFN